MTQCVMTRREREPVVAGGDESGEGDLVAVESLGIGRRREDARPLPDAERRGVAGCSERDGAGALEQRGCAGVALHGELGRQGRRRRQHDDRDDPRGEDAAGHRRRGSQHAGPVVVVRTGRRGIRATELTPLLIRRRMRVRGAVTTICVG